MSFFTNKREKNISRNHLIVGASLSNTIGTVCVCERGRVFCRFPQYLAHCLFEIIYLPLALIFDMLEIKQIHFVNIYINLLCVVWCTQSASHTLRHAQRNQLTYDRANKVLSYLYYVPTT